MSFPSWRDWLFSAKAFLASMLALFVALSLDLPRPYWAMAAVYVVANPLAGATSSKGLYRALGTLLGASAAVFLVPLFVNAPELLSLVIALWTGTLLFLSMLDRSARSYVFMLAGYSLPLIALPSVGAPETIFDTALARSEEIIIGITCASIVSAVVFPASVRTVLGGRIVSWFDDAGSWADEILRGEGASPATPLKRQKLAADVTGLDLIISQLGHDANGRDIVRHSRELRGRLLMLLPLFSSLADRLHALKADGERLPAELSNVLNDIADWLRQGGKGEAGDNAERLRGRVEALQQSDPDNVGWNALLFRSALARQAEIVDLWHDCLTLRDQIRSSNHAGPWHPVFRHRRIVGRNRHYDYALLAFAASSVIAAIVVASFFWIFSGWQNGAGFVTMAAVACSFFAALLLGLLIPKPQFNMLAMLLAVNSASFIALQDRYSSDFTTFANEAIAALAGIGFALGWTLIARPFGAELAARRLLRAGWRDLAETAAGERRTDHEQLSGRILDRLGQLVPRLAAVEDRELKKVDGFAEVRLGFNVLMLQTKRAELRGSSSLSVGHVLTGVSDFYRSRLKAGQAIDPPDDLRQSIDDSLATVVLENPQADRENVDALVGLRRALFPEAAPPANWRDPQALATPLQIAAE
ncbi:FUSC family protein (plasmid) [Rhizobium ruizarguesonis]|uniref:FUSC family protein n=1 Tax=Rhizobium ruizarguesonis TaxID=2081791 RepID=UPI0010322C9A|nr:FUSC family protein [Rhizobium ruizarguesonis]TBA99957.1 FUSC family protein [Rhizobium ruizarguesonis]